MKDFFSIFFGREDARVTIIDWKEVSPYEDLEGIAEKMSEAKQAKRSAMMVTNVASSPKSLLAKSAN